MINVALPKECPKVLKQCTLTSFTICPGCGLIISNGDHKYLEHPMAQGIGAAMITHPSHGRINEQTQFYEEGRRGIGWVVGLAE